eukprot:gb/GECH01013526.1/.p1 GENE.gb/GECH01013526.1/~~gb/GECH01013526.1/.p1  ORF type:complete len:178 (+),score=70.40 gb/GECH01013526.1/:1-534(+)
MGCNNSKQNDISSSKRERVDSSEQQQNQNSKNQQNRGSSSVAIGSNNNNEQEGGELSKSHAESKIDESEKLKEILENTSKNLIEISQTPAVGNGIEEHQVDSENNSFQISEEVSKALFGLPTPSENNNTNVLSSGITSSEVDLIENGLSTIVSGIEEMKVEPVGELVVSLSTDTGSH